MEWDQCISLLVAMGYTLLNEFKSSLQTVVVVYNTIQQRMD